MDVIPALAPPPRTRGSTFRKRPAGYWAAASPAYAGIDPTFTCLPSSKSCLPRVRGDRPYPFNNLPGPGEPPPRTRGSTSEELEETRLHNASPAYAGIDLSPSAPNRNSRSLPRVRGDRPFAYLTYHGLDMPPPRTRGSTSFHVKRTTGRNASPAYAGIDPCAAS